MPVRILPETESLLQRYNRGERARHDPHGRSKLAVLGVRTIRSSSPDAERYSPTAASARIGAGSGNQTARRFKDALVRLDDDAPEAVYVCVLLPPTCSFVTE